ncbi:unnamed protein product [Arabis nemorensis]|uniref:Uncharacterized protein n=1 Tax=Arabis nemorensis TaxID=586526 RepID=A0A565C3V6_9BRAS|nr:unnamed protein product [Arabis nemorensis]
MTDTSSHDRHIFSEIRVDRTAGKRQEQIKEDKDMAAPELQSLAATALEKEYRLKAPSEFNLLS